MTNGREIPECIEQLRSLRCLDAVAKAGSVRRAAELVHLSQPAITRAIQAVESRQRVRFFERAARGMIPTVIGQRAAARAATLLAHLRQGVLDAGARGPSGERGATRFAASVDPSSLKALYAVAVAGTEARAGASLGVSQPAVHQALRRLQERAGIPLFQRTPKGTYVTAAGERVLRQVKLAFHEARALESEIAVWRGEFRGQVIVGVLPLSIGPVIAHAMTIVHARHPRVGMSVVEGTYSNLSHQLLNADIDILVGALREVAPPGLEQRPLYSDELAIVARVGHPCLKGKPSLRSLARWEWVAPLPGTPASESFIEAFAAEHVRAPSASIRSSSGVFIRSIVRRTNRLALFLRRQAQEDERAGVLKIVPVRLPSTSRMIGIAVRDAASSSPEVNELVRALHTASVRYQ